MKIFIETLGCPKNEVDSESMAGILVKSGHEICDLPEDADVLIVNTCGFIRDAKLESIDAVFDMAAVKSGDNNAKHLIMTGCLSQRYSEELFESMPEVDAFLGVNDYTRLPVVIDMLQGSHDMTEIYGRVKSAINSLDDTTDENSGLNRVKASDEPGFTAVEGLSEDEESGEEVSVQKMRIRYASESPAKYCEIEERSRLSGGVSSYLRIAEGCSNICSYCIIPFIRGSYRSREMEAVINEANQLAASGTKELVLVAQDTTAYGIDIYGEYKLASLLRELCKIEGIEWIRLMYCYEDSITDELIDTIRREKKICRYLDIPLQHISDPILQAMNRRSTTLSIERKIMRLRQRIPDIHIRTTFITGFPGETDEDFRQLIDFVEDTEFDRLGVFAFSAEEGTEAEAMPDQIDDDIAARRQEDIMLIQKEISLRKNREMIGKIYRVLVEEGPDEDGVYYGRTEFDAKEIDNSVIISSDRQLLPGTFIDVEITDAFDYDLTGRDVGVSDSSPDTTAEMEG